MSAHKQLTIGLFGFGVVGEGLYKVLQQTPSLKLFLLTGICGGLSTFSTFSFETYELLKQGQIMWASSNILISVLLCLVIFFTFIGK